MKRRTHRASTAVIAAMLLMGLAAGHAAADGPRHGLSAFGDLAYPADFKHFRWVNPDAPIIHSWWYDPAKAAKLKSN